MMTELLLTALNHYVQSHIMRRQLHMPDSFPPDIRERVCRESRYSCGFTGFKATDYHFVYPGGAMHADVSAGLVGQWLIAVAPTPGYAHEPLREEAPRTWSWHYYYANVPGPGDGPYEPGALFDLPPVEERQKVLRLTEDELVVLLQDGINRVCAAVVAGEQYSKEPE